MFDGQDALNSLAKDLLAAAKSVGVFAPDFINFSING